MNYWKTNNENLSEKNLTLAKKNDFLENKMKTLCSQFDNRESQIVDLE